MYQTILSLHIIFIVTWFAGLFNIVRLFVYQTEAKHKTEQERAVLEPQYKLMARRLWYGITWPSCILTLIFGPWLLYLNPVFLKMPFMHIKLSFVFGLLVYQIICHVMFNKLQGGEHNYSSGFFRIWNEVATLFLVAIVFLIVMKSSLNWVYGTLGFIGVAIALMIAIQVYRKLRKK
ncbi:MAG: CopD family protein [Crocinitomicaceae bacterium]|nr:CopD family protein [Crocinitomicaceae bacterium]MBK8927255.1 CopD family protein [Crocinitomicaceae bacterium]